MGRSKLTTAQTALMMAVLTMLSKILGFVREMVMANCYGAGMVTDAFVMAENIPNYLMAAIITAVGTAYMPCFSRKYELEGPKAADDFTSDLLNWQMIVATALIVAGELLSPYLVRFFAPGYGAEAASLTNYYLRAAFFITFFNIFISIFGSYLQYKEIFISPILFGYAQNILVIAFILLSVRAGERILVFGLLLGYAVRGLAYLALAVRSGYRYRASLHLGPLVKEVMVLAVPVFIGGWVNQINAFIDKMLASRLPEGSVSALNYANLVVGVITALSVTVITTMVYPRFNKALAGGDYGKVAELTAGAVHLAALITIPFCLGAMAFAQPVIQVLFERGAFDVAATAATAPAFRFYALTLFFGGVSQIYTYLFYSLKDMRSGVISSVVAVVCNIALNLLLIGPMGVAGLALATGLAQAINAGMLLFLFRRRHAEIRPKISAKKLLLTLAFSLAAVAGALLCYRLLSAWISSILLRLVLAVGLAMGIYLALLYIARFEELSLLRGLLGRRKSDGE